MIELINECKKRIESVACQYQFNDVLWDAIHVENPYYPSHYSVLCGLGTEVFTVSCYHESDMQNQLDNLYDKVTRYLYSIRIEILEKLINKTSVVVYYSYSHEDKNSGKTYAIQLQLKDAIECYPLQEEVLLYFGVGNLEDGELKELIKYVLKENYLNNLNSLNGK